MRFWAKGSECHFLIEEKGYKALFEVDSLQSSLWIYLPSTEIGSIYIGEFGRQKESNINKNPKGLTDSDSDLSKISVMLMQCLLHRNTTTQDFFFFSS